MADNLFFDFCRHLCIKFTLHVEIGIPIAVYIFNAFNLCRTIRYFSFFGVHRNLNDYTMIKYYQFVFVIGAGVTTTRGHVHYVVTEYGIAFLFGKSLRQRAYELIKISHPDHRESLEKSAFERLKVMPSL